MLDKAIVRSIIDMFIFLEFSEDSQIDEDVAVSQMEALAAQLHGAPEATRMDLVEMITELAPQYGEHSDFVRALPRTIGLE
ncbi:hypothetical protein [Herbaspirillum huttiense]|uniref:hypothetical protein n=1 Tax=Herbaspirillum huttiense TaxID=863372 RepID=UPI002E7A10D4|nr:hypothetical protein [Herbaspirillum huttiense]MEE1639226.1 hypothetical protein [Herbaspirillum huttiense NC40101]